MEEIYPAAISGIISTIVCNPLDTIRVNYQLKNKIIINSEIFYKGITYGLIAIPSFWSIYFPVYKKIKSYTNNSTAAYVSCCIASTFTTPFFVLRQKAQTGKSHDFKNTKFSSYYKGLIATYLINLNFTVQIPVYEYIKTKIDNTNTNIFLATAFSKTIATCIFYPLDTIRVAIRNGDSFKNMVFYRGVSIYLLRSIPYHTSIFCTYEFIKKRMYERPCK